MRVLLFWLGLCTRAVLAQYGSGFGGGSTWTPPPPKCPKFSCPANQKPVAKESYKVWAYGCKQSSFISPASFDPKDPLAGLKNQKTVDKCCVEKEICHRTCGMSAVDCHNNFQKCVQKFCKADQNCLMMAQLSDLMSDTDVTGKFDKPEDRKCASFDKDQREACECVPKEDWQQHVETRLKSFYKEFNPEKLDTKGELKDTKQIWKQWKGKEPEMFLELTKKYREKAVDIRQRPSDLPPDVESSSESETAEGDAQEAAEEEDAFSKQLRQLEADKEAAKAAEDYDLAEELKAKMSDLKLAEVQRLREEKAAAVSAEDYLKAKQLKRRLSYLDPKNEL